MGKTAEEMANEVNDALARLKNEIKELKDNGASNDQIKEAEKALNDYKTDIAKQLEDYVKSEDLESIKTQLAEANKEISSLKEGGEGAQPVSFAKAIRDAIKEKHEELKDFVSRKQKGGYFTIEVKAPATFTSANVTTDTTPDNYAASLATDVSPYIREEIFVEQYLDSGETDLPSLPYVDESAGEGDAAIVAEGGLKPLIDADFNVKYSTAVKVAGRMKASEESLSDFKWLESALRRTLRRKHDIARQNDVVTKIKAAATPFNASQLGSLAGSMPNTGASQANNYDVIAAMYNAIITESEGTFIPNVAFVNNIDMLAMKLTKDGDGNYILPPFISQDGNVIEGIRIVAQPSLTAGEFIIGDMMNIKVRNLWDYKVQVGWENDDFSKNLVTMIGESRYHVYVTENDKRGIITGTFADVKTALNAV